MAALSSAASMKERYEAAMVLGGTGDAMGYNNGNWEFNQDGCDIHRQVTQLGGVTNLKIGPPHFILSDDTILHIATAEALVSDWKNREELFCKIAAGYKAGCRDMGGRAPGPTTLSGVSMLRPNEAQGYCIPFNSRGGGCGAAMRSAPIGLAFSGPDQLEDLVAAAVESGRMTHNHPTGYLGSLTSALFVSYSIQSKPPKEWGAGLLETLDMARKYVKETGRDVEKNEEAWGYFSEAWSKYLERRGIKDGKSEPNFPEEYGVLERDEFYSRISFAGWGGASGHDAPMIAYDAILGADDSWEELCLRGVLHGGDNDSTGIIACSCWGAMHGFEGVPERNYRHLEYLDRLQSLGEGLYEKACSIGCHGDAAVTVEPHRIPDVDVTPDQDDPEPSPDIDQVELKEKANDSEAKDI